MFDHCDSNGNLGVVCCSSPVEAIAVGAVVFGLVDRLVWLLLESFGIAGRSGTPWATSRPWTGDFRSGLVFGRQNAGDEPTPQGHSTERPRQSACTKSPKDEDFGNKKKPNQPQNLKTPNQPQNPKPKTHNLNRKPPKPPIPLPKALLAVAAATSWFTKEQLDEIDGWSLGKGDGQFCR